MAKNPWKKWAHREGLVRALLSYKDARWREDDGYWTAEGWNKIAEEFNTMFPDVHVTMAEIKRQTRALKLRYDLIKEIRKTRDVGWDPVLYWIIAPDAVWEDLIQADPRASKVREKPFPLYDLFGSLYEGMETSTTKWTRTYEEGLVHVLVRYKDAKWREHDDEWTAEGWNKVAEEFNKKFPDSHMTMTEIKSQTSALKNRYELIREIRKRSDVAWDSDNYWIVAHDTLWEELIQADPRVREVKHKPFPLYDLFDSLYEAREASLPKPPEKIPSEHCNSQDSLFIESKKKRILGEGSRMTRAMANFLEFKRREHNGFSISSCTRILLYGMEELTKDEKVVGCDVFLDARNREIFVSLSPDLRILWIRRKIAELIQADPRAREVKHKPFPLYDLFDSLYEAQEASLPKPPEKIPSEHRNSQDSLLVASKKKRILGEGSRMTHAMANFLEFERPKCEHEDISLMVQDGFSITRCTKLLNGMEELTKDEKVVGCDVFLDARNREIFVSLSPDFRILWIRRKIAGLVRFMGPTTGG